MAVARRPRFVLALLLITFGLAAATFGVLAGIAQTSDAGVECGTAFRPTDLWEFPVHPDEAVVDHACVALTTSVRIGAWSLIGLGAACIAFAVFLLLRAWNAAQAAAGAEPGAQA